MPPNKKAKLSRRTATGEEILALEGIQIVFLGRQGFTPRCNHHVIAAMDEYWRALYRLHPPEPYPVDEDKEKRRENCRSKQLTEFMDDYSKQFGPIQYWKLHEAEDRRMDSERCMMSKTFVDISHNIQGIKGSLRTMMTTSMLKAKKRRLDELGLLFPADAYENRPRDDEGNFLPVLPDNSMSKGDAASTGAMSEDGDFQDPIEEALSCGYTSNGIPTNGNAKPTAVDPTKKPLNGSHQQGDLDYERQVEQQRLMAEQQLVALQLQQVKEQRRVETERSGEDQSTSSRDIHHFEHGQKEKDVHVPESSVRATIQTETTQPDQAQKPNHPHMPPPPPQYHYPPPAPTETNMQPPITGIPNGSHQNEVVATHPPTKHARPADGLGGFNFEGCFESVRTAAMAQADQWEKTDTGENFVLKRMKRLCADGFRRDLDDITKSYQHQMGHRQVALESASSLKAREKEFKLESNLYQMHAKQMILRINYAGNDMIDRFYILCGHYENDKQQIEGASVAGTSGVNSASPTPRISASPQISQQHLPPASAIPPQQPPAQTFKPLHTLHHPASAMHPMYHHHFVPQHQLQLQQQMQQQQQARRSPQQHHQQHHLALQAHAAGPVMSSAGTPGPAELLHSASNQVPNNGRPMYFPPNYDNGMNGFYHQPHQHQPHGWVGSHHPHAPQHHPQNNGQANSSLTAPPRHSLVQAASNTVAISTPATNATQAPASIATINADVKAAVSPPSNGAVPDEPIVEPIAESVTGSTVHSITEPVVEPISEPKPEPSSPPTVIPSPAPVVTSDTTNIIHTTPPSANKGMAALFSAIEQQEEVEMDFEEQGDSDDRLEDDHHEDDETEEEPQLEKSELSYFNLLVSATEKEKDAISPSSQKLGKRRRSKTGNVSSGGSIGSGSKEFPKVGGKANNHAQSRARVKRSWTLDPSERVYQDHYDKDVDVLLGRGGLAGANPGNKAYMARARELFRSCYRSAKKEDKKQISLQLVQYVENRGGKFMAYDEEEKKWFPVHPNRAREKASQALRECEKRRPSAEDAHGSFVSIPPETGNV